MSSPRSVYSPRTHRVIVPHTQISSPAQYGSCAFAPHDRITCQIESLPRLLRHNYQEDTPGASALWNDDGIDREGSQALKNQFPPFLGHFHSYSEVKSKCFLCGVSGLFCQRKFTIYFSIAQLRFAAFFGGVCLTSTSQPLLMALLAGPFIIIEEQQQIKKMAFLQRECQRSTITGIRNVPGKFPVTLLVSLTFPKSVRRLQLQVLIMSCPFSSVTFITDSSF